MRVRDGEGESETGREIERERQRRRIFKIDNSILKSVCSKYLYRDKQRVREIYIYSIERDIIYS